MTPPVCVGISGVELVRDLLATGHSVRVRVGGRSMWPTLREGDVVFLRPIGAAPGTRYEHSEAGPRERIEPRRGDVVLRETSAGSLLLHRLTLVSRAEPSGEYVFTTCGDALVAADEPARGSQLLAVAEFVLERDGTWRRIRKRSNVARLALRALAVSRRAGKHLAGVASARSR